MTGNQSRDYGKRSSLKHSQRRNLLKLDEYLLAEAYVATFTGRASSEVALKVLGHLLSDLKFESPLENQEDVVLHNAALRIVRKMNAFFSLDPKRREQAALVLVHEKPDEP